MKNTREYRIKMARTDKVATNRKSEEVRIPDPSRIDSSSMTQTILDVVMRGARVARADGGGFATPLGQIPDGHNSKLVIGGDNAPREVAAPTILDIVREASRRARNKQ